MAATAADLHMRARTHTHTHAHTHTRYAVVSDVVVVAANAVAADVFAAASIA